ncbi:hypothetical protein, partial [Shigella sp. FC1661]|uniref:hypothetical protein n=1 Tax=Shigella sp. FC1661 TaxID=1886513 RepID=UPI001C0A75A0
IPASLSIAVQPEMATTIAEAKKIFLIISLSYFFSCYQRVKKKHRITETILHAIFFLRRILKGYGQIFLRSLS